MQRASERIRGLSEPARLGRAMLLSAMLILVAACGSSNGDGDGGGTCPDGQTLVEEPMTNLTECEPGGSLDACSSSCPSYCTENGFPLGSRGQSCVTDVFGSFCECLCAYCR